MFRIDILIAGHSKYIRVMNQDKKIFTYEQALDLLPHVQALTDSAVAHLEALVGSDVEAPAEVPREMSSQYHQIVSDWASSVLELGIEVKGVWLVDFDSGSGYYCWKYPEPSLQYFHGYEEGYAGRVELN